MPRPEDDFFKLDVIALSLGGSVASIAAAAAGMVMGATATQHQL